jgi:uncharacterized RDD family membrane protein YckC
MTRTKKKPARRNLLLKGLILLGLVFEASRFLLPEAITSKSSLLYGQLIVTIVFAIIIVACLLLAHKLPKEKIRLKRKASFLAPVPLRAAAYLIDTLMITAPASIIKIVGTVIFGKDFYITTVFELIAFIWMICAYYFVRYQPTLFTGASLGKKWLGLKVVDTSSEPPSWDQILGRDVLLLFEGMVAINAAFYFIVASPSRQRLGDRIAGTYVIKR